MWEMPFYDIMLLYKAFEKHVDEENKSQEEERSRYEQDYLEQKQAMNSAMNPYSNFKMPDMSSMSKGMPSIPNFNIPKF